MFHPKQFSLLSKVNISFMICAIRMDHESSWMHLLTVSLFIVVTTTCGTRASAGNISDFPGDSSGSRLAYYRWQEWLLSRPAVKHKIPPKPTTSLIEEDAQGVFALFSASKHRLRINALFTPASVYQVDVASQTAQMSGRLVLWWQDSALAIDQNLVEEFTDGNITLMPRSMMLPAQNLWLPRIIFVEGITTLNILNDAEEARIVQDGTTYIVLPLILTFSCRFKMNEYPFDEHHCPITLFDISSSLDIFPSGLSWDTRFHKKFIVSGEWELVNVTEKTLSNLASGGMIYPSFVLHLRRKTTFYSVVMLFPMVLTSYLNVLVFLLPPDLGDKASYLVTLTVSMSVYVAFFNTDMPRGLDSMPRIFVLLIFVYAESFCILLMCLAVLKKYAAEKERQDAEAKVSSCIRRKRNGVSPSEDDEEGVKKRRVSGVSAKKLDTILFVVAFLVNTVGMALILKSLTDDM